MEKTYFSNRIYKSTLPKSDTQTISDTLIQYNRAKHTAYKLLLNQHNYNIEYDRSVHMQIKEKFGFNDYFANSAVQEAKAQLSSQKELRKFYIDSTREQIKTKEKKIKSTTRRIKILQKLHGTVKKGRFIAPANGNIKLHDSGIISVDFKKYSLVFFNIYDFEHRYLVPEIKRLKNRVKQINCSLIRPKEKFGKLQSSFLKGCTFGTKKLFKQQFTKEEYINNHDRWLSDWRRARYSSMRISGRLDAKYGNFVFKYDYVNKMLTFTLPRDKKIQVPTAFPYGQENVDTAIVNMSQRRKPIAWMIEDHGEYYIFKVTIDVPANPYSNYNRPDGAIGIDMNYDHAALAEINSTGNLLEYKIVNYNLDGLSTGQAVKVLEKAAIEIVGYAKSKNKPIVIEDLKIISGKFRLKYGNKKRNKKIAQFAYQVLTGAVIARADKEGVGVFKVKPEYTSVIGKLKYMAQKGISPHVAAALVVARRGLKFKEKVPPVLSVFLPEQIRRRHHWAHWSYLGRQVNIKTHCLYNVGKGLKGSTLKEALRNLEFLDSCA